MMKKKITAWLLAVFLITMLEACSTNKNLDNGGYEESGPPERNPVQIGLIISGEETELCSNLHIHALKEAAQSDAEITIKQGVADADCYSVALELAELGCNVIFAVGDELEDYIVQAATETDVQFCVAEGAQAEQIKLPNLHSYAADETVVRYFSGIAAGMKLNDMIQNGEISDDDIKMGYVGTVTSAENRSAYTAFYLGVKSVCPGVSLYVQYAGGEYDVELEESAAAALIANGCKLIAQHSYANGAAEICRQNNVFFVGNLAEVDGEFWIASSSVDWSGCYAYAMDCIGEGEALPIWWSRSGGTIIKLNKNAFVSEEIYEETQNIIIEAQTALEEGNLKVFGTSTWTVGGETVSSTAGEALWFDYYGEEYIKNGYFAEYEYSAQPKFMFVIDGITELN